MIFRAFFYIKSPLQYINAIEAKYHYRYSFEECLLVVSTDVKNSVQIDNLVDPSEWGAILNLSGSSLWPKLSSNFSAKEHHLFFKNSIYSICKLKYVARKYGPVERVFIGDARNALMQHLANVTRCHEVVLLDDGVGSRLYAQWRNEGWDGEEFRLKKRASRFLKSIFLGLKGGLPPSLTFFSAYNMEVSSRDTLLRNEFSVLRKKFIESASHETVYFLGGALVEAGILTENEYFSQLEKVSEHYRGIQVKYIAHRRESNDRLRSIQEKLGWEPELFDYPIEYQLAVIGPRPKELASFISSALENCHAIFGDTLKIVSFRFNPGSFSQKNTERGEGVWRLFDHYAQMSDNSFVVVDL